MTFELILFLVFIGAPMSMVIHEFGHALGAFLVKSDQINIHIGSGKTLFTVTLKNIHLHVHTLLMFGGFTNYERPNIYQRRELLFITILGPMSNFFFAFIFILIHINKNSSMLVILFLFNIWLGVMNILPYQLKGRASDGLIAFRLCRQIYRERNSSE